MLSEEILLPYRALAGAVVNQALVDLRTPNPRPVAKLSANAEEKVRERHKVAVQQYTYMLHSAKILRRQAAHFLLDELWMPDNIWGGWLRTAVPMRSFRERIKVLMKKPPRAIGDPDEEVFEAPISHEEEEDE